MKGLTLELSRATKWRRLGRIVSRRPVLPCEPIQQHAVEDSQRDDGIHSRKIPVAAVADGHDQSQSGGRQEPKRGTDYWCPWRGAGGDKACARAKGCGDPDREHDDEDGRLSQRVIELQEPPLVREEGEPTQEEIQIGRQHEPTGRPRLGQDDGELNDCGDGGKLKRMLPPQPIRCALPERVGREK